MYQIIRIKGICIACCLLVTQTAWGNALEDFIRKPEPGLSLAYHQVVNGFMGVNRLL